MNVLARFIDSSPLSIIEGWLLILSTFVGLYIFAAVVGAILDRYEARRQRRLEEHYVAELLRRSHPVSERSSKELFDALMSAGRRSDLPPHVVPFVGKGRVH